METINSTIDILHLAALITQVSDLSQIDYLLACNENMVFQEVYLVFHETQFAFFSEVSNITDFHAYHFITNFNKLTKKLSHTTKCNHKNGCFGTLKKISKALK